jgi:two-component sensor histidine kinase
VDKQLRLHWRESGGPPVSPPHHSGFGSLLIESELAKQLKGDVRLDYDPAGVICEIVMPFPGAVTGDAP